MERSECRLLKTHLVRLIFKNPALQVSARRRHRQPRDGLCQRHHGGRCDAHADAQLQPGQPAALPVRAEEEQQGLEVGGMQRQRHVWRAGGAIFRQGAQRRSVSADHYFIRQITHSDVLTLKSMPLKNGQFNCTT